MLVNREYLVNRESVIEKVENFFDASVGDELVIYNDDKGSFLGLNEIGSEIFAILDGPTKIADLILKLSSRFDVDQAELEADVLEFINELKEYELIRIIEP
tara:strand:- start:5492 stop:5794 length:303 start_codon:yes stop_codon:yes gene_type:complete